MTTNLATNLIYLFDVTHTNFVFNYFAYFNVLETNRMARRIRHPTKPSQNIDI
jgi:hypothetical protein